MLNVNNGFEIVLASSSTRRQNLFNKMEIKFRIEIKSVNEVYPSNLRGFEIPQYIVKKKAAPFKNFINEKELIITADTIVWHDNMCLGKPKSKLEAKSMLKSLSSNSHEVITAVGFLQKNNWQTIYEISKVTFGLISEKEILSYIETGSTMDKAGSYGIQDPFGIRNITSIEGSYTNIIGLPVTQVLKKINEITSQK